MAKLASSSGISGLKVILEDDYYLIYNVNKRGNNMKMKYYTLSIIKYYITRLSS